MTLLVFGLAVPLATDGQDLAAELAEMWPEFLIYVLSFLVLGVFWLVHHLIFDTVQRYDTTLIWLNIVFLMLASLVPFSTRLFIEHGAVTVIAVVYGAIDELHQSFVPGRDVSFLDWIADSVGALLVVSALVLVWSREARATFLYVTVENRLTASDLDPDIIRGGRRMGYVYMAVMVVATAVSLISPVAAFILYGAFVMTIIIFTLLGRAEAVVILPETSDKTDQDLP